MHAMEVRSAVLLSVVLEKTSFYETDRCVFFPLQLATMPDLVRMDLQPELKAYMKPYLVEFLVEIHQQFRLRPEVLYLSLNIVDRYVSKRVVFKKHYQLVGCAALWIAAKFEVCRNSRWKGFSSD